MKEQEDSLASFLTSSLSTSLLHSLTCSFVSLFAHSLLLSLVIFNQLVLIKNVAADIFVRAFLDEHLKYYKKVVKK